jgi:cytochrome P450
MTSVPQADAGLPFLHYETAKFMHEVSNNPSVGDSSENLWTAIGRYTYSTFSSQTFGMDIPDIDNPVIQYIHETGLAQILFTLPGSNMVDIFPWLSNLPLLFKPWEREGRARFKRDMEWCVERLYRIKKGKASNIMQDAFLPKVLEDEKHLGFSTLEEPSYLALMLIMGAADTSRMSTWSFLEAMMMFPDVQEKGHREVERVVGDRLPVYADLGQIPYIRCVMKEVWRWRPPVGLGHPHTTTRELSYGGYRIPKGARLHLNSWAIGHNPKRHVDPERFWPERYADDLTNSTQSMHSSDVRQRDHFAFGSGRRVCPGINVAERSLAVAIMRILWAFKVAPAADAKLPLDPADYRADMPGNPGTNLPVTLTVRSEKKRAIIDQAFKEANESRVALVSIFI